MRPALPGVHDVVQARLARIGRIARIARLLKLMRVLKYLDGSRGGIFAQYASEGVSVVLAEHSRKLRILVILVQMVLFSHLLACVPIAHAHSARNLHWNRHSAFKLPAVCNGRMSQVLARDDCNVCGP